MFEVNGSPRPVCEVTTLFRSGFVYDFLRHPEIKDPETTIFDPFKGRLVVIDPERKLWTQVSAADIQDFTSKLRIEAAGHTDGLLNFLAAPKFKETTENGQTVLTSAFIVYKLKTVPAKSAEVSHEYAEFSHWFAQLNVMVKPGQLPPFARLKINEMLEERQLLPTEVQLTIEPKEPRVANHDAPRRASLSMDPVGRRPPENPNGRKATGDLPPGDARGIQPSPGSHGQRQATAEVGQEIARLTLRRL